MRNLLQEQLLKAGLVDEKKAKAAEREKAQQRKQQKQNKAGETGPSEAEKLLAERAERDRALAAQQKSEKLLAEQQAQIKQIIAHYQQKRDGDIAYNFSDAGKLKTLYMSEKLRQQVIKGHLVIVRNGEAYALVPRAAAEKITLRDASVIVLDNRSTQSAEMAAEVAAEEDPYKDFRVPDDLMW